MEKEFVVYQSKRKQIGLSLLGLFMVLMSLFIFLAGAADKQYLVMIVGVIGCVFFGACEVFIIKQVFKGKELVVLTVEGFYDYSSALATKKSLIHWSDVRTIESTRMVNQDFVSVYLKDPDAFLAKVSSFQRKAIKANSKMGYGEINITLQSANKCSNDQLIAKMHLFLDQAEKIGVLQSSSFEGSE
ncbi:STM3941 family protein [Candidatus Enterococcus murrayae]|uniref:Uncharacterized protein n=1 Tax=Candidatus Enterococcus murrayae TaxID=2815321 RepID=A0ABS3HJS3_9ENTE|nr:STM3941 family protein [Enterococcus sp. MJM16]MBO0453695.1 hypothetical protein [Enterococcus sp. MJM16]